MSTPINTLKGFIENVTGVINPEKENIKKEKQQLATDIVQGLLEKDATFILSDEGKMVIKYLAPDDFAETVQGSVYMATLWSLSSWREFLVRTKERIKLATQGELQLLKEEIFLEIRGEKVIIEGKNDEKETQNEKETEAEKETDDAKRTESSSKKEKDNWLDKEEWHPPLILPEDIPNWKDLFNFDNLFSLPIERSKSGTTLCSKTARLNWAKFGIELPYWDARDAQKKAPIDKKFVESIKNSDSKKALSFSGIAETANFADIYTTASSEYGHRAIAFLNHSDKNWYVLDPYTRGIHTEGEDRKKPVLLANYQKKKRVIEAKFYDADRYVA